MSKGKAAARRERRDEQQRLLTERALAITCPACGTDPGVWCFMRGLLGPGLHERRWGAAA